MSTEYVTNLDLRDGLTVCLSQAECAIVQSSNIQHSSNPFNQVRSTISLARYGDKEPKIQNENASEILATC